MLQGCYTLAPRFRSRLAIGCWHVGSCPCSRVRHTRAAPLCGAFCPACASLYPAGVPLWASSWCGQTRVHPVATATACLSLSEAWRTSQTPAYSGRRSVLWRAPLSWDRVMATSVCRLTAHAFARPAAQRWCVGALFDDFPLELGQRPEQVEDVIAARGRGIDVLPQAHTSTSVFAELRDGDNEVLARAPESVPPPDHQRIPCSQRLHGFLQAGRSALVPLSLGRWSYPRPPHLSLRHLSDSPRAVAVARCLVLFLICVRGVSLEGKHGVEHATTRLQLLRRHYLRTAELVEACAEVAERARATRRVGPPRDRTLLSRPAMSGKCVCCHVGVDPILASAPAHRCQPLTCQVRLANQIS
jgi:hypothetical protein